MPAAPNSPLQISPLTQAMSSNSATGQQVMRILPKGLPAVGALGIRYVEPSVSICHVQQLCGHRQLDQLVNVEGYIGFILWALNGSSRDRVSHCFNTQIRASFMCEMLFFYEDSQNICPEQTWRKHLCVVSTRSETSAL
ncbi:hypothetical protein AV530_005134 [Patagioenas fasciata monilis]|uniref:Uncharacterized protein n=1 Tax=Patagioenas fasciata monilis TaxID=372326 RepID=A0A1V4K454_PATFA|nr:hypothetical protein AV530_005134 [Patagioenas fasciata monilis]